MPTIISPRTRTIGFALSLAVTLGCPRPTTSGPGPDGPEPKAPAADTDDSLVPAPLPGDPLRATVHRLSNGMRVYVSPDATLPEIHTYIAVRAGSADEPPNSTGLAHYLEHMLFKGTDEIATLDFGKEKPELDRIATLYAALRDASADERKKILVDIDAANQRAAQFSVPNDLDRLYGRIGIGGVNAYTYFDETYYQTEVPPNRLEQWAAIEAERFSDAEFRLFLPELESVYEEKNLELDSPGDLTSLTLRGLVFGDHPYARPILGSIEHLKTPAYADMVEFYRRWYRPSNMAVILAGDVTPEHALPVLERTLGQLPAADTTASPLPPVEPLRGRVFATVRAPGTAQVRLAWQTVPDGHPDAAAIELLAALLDNEGTGLMTLAMERPQVVPAVWVDETHLAEAGWIVVGAIAREDQVLDEVERLVLEQVDRLRGGDFTTDDVRAIVQQLELNEAYDWEDNEERADVLVDAFTHDLDWSDVVQYRARRRALTREDLIAVANRIFGPDFAAVHRIDGKLDAPKLDKPRITPAPSNADSVSAFASDVAAQTVPPLAPDFVQVDRDYVRGRLAAGEFLWASNRRNDLMQLTYRFEAGLRARPLLCTALELLEVSDTQRRSIDDLQLELYALGGVINFECATEYTEIHIFGPDRHLEKLIGLVREWVETSQPDPTRWKSLRDNATSLRQDALQNPEFMAQAVTTYALRGPQSPLLAEPTNASLQATNAATLLEEARQLLRLPHRTVYFGPRSVGAVVGVVALSAPTDTVPPRPALRHRRPKEPTVFVLHQDRVGADVSVLWARDAIENSDRAAVRVFDYYFDGDSSARLYRELRELRGLVYSSSAALYLGARPDDDAYLRLTFASQADKAVEALDVSFDILTEPVDERLFVLAQGAVEQSMRRHRTEPRSVVYSVRAWDDAKLAGDPAGIAWAALPDVTAEDLRRLQALARDRPPIVVVAGDLDRIGRQRLAGYGRIVEVAPRDMIAWAK